MKVFNVSRARGELGDLVRAVCAPDAEPVGIALGRRGRRGLTEGNNTDHTDHAVLISSTELDRLRKAANHCTSNHTAADAT